MPKLLVCMMVCFDCRCPVASRQVCWSGTVLLWSPCTFVFVCLLVLLRCVVQANDMESVSCEMSVREFLVARGCSFGDVRFVVILEFLSDADVVCPEDFIGLRAIAKIPGVHVLTMAEVGRLQDVVDKVSAEKQQKLMCA